MTNDNFRGRITFRFYLKKADSKQNLALRFHPRYNVDVTL